MNQCKRCKDILPSGARFCHSCGAAAGPGFDQGHTVVAPVAVTALPATQDPPWSPSMFTPGIRVEPDDSVFSRSAVQPVMGGQREHSTHVVDHSGSMGEKFRDLMTKLVATQRACSNMIISKERIDPADEIGLVAFNHAAQVLLPISPLSTHKRQMLEVLQTLTAGGGTDINAGLKAARDLFDWGRQDVVRRVILLTDGHGGEPLATAEDLKGRGVVIDVIGIGPTPNHVNEKLLRKVASFIDGELHYRFIKDQRTLVDHYTRLAGKTKVGV